MIRVPVCGVGCLAKNSSGSALVLHAQPGCQHANHNPGNHRKNPSTRKGTPLSRPLGSELRSVESCDSPKCTAAVMLCFCFWLCLHAWSLEPWLWACLELHLHAGLQRNADSTRRMERTHRALTVWLAAAWQTQHACAQTYLQQQRQQQQ